MSQDVILSYLPDSCPERLRRSLAGCCNSSEILDVLLKILSDTSNSADPQHEIAIDLLRDAAFDLSMQSSEAEFTVLSLQNICSAQSFEQDIQSKILMVMVLVVLAQKDRKADLAEVIAETFIAVYDDTNTSSQVRQTALECLIELETNVSGTLLKSLDWCLELSNNETNYKGVELLGVVLSNSSSIMEQEFRIRVLKHLIQLIPRLEPFTMTTVTRTVLDSGNDIVDTLELQLTEALKLLMEKYSSTSDLCILQTITSLQAQTSGVKLENPLWTSCTHVALPVARHLIALDWLAECSHVEHERDSSINVEYRQCLKSLEPTPFDGADSRLKKMILIDRLLEGNPTVISPLLEQLMHYAIHIGTSRSMAAVYRLLNHALSVNSSNFSRKMVVECCVTMATRCPLSLPHLVDFMKWIRSSRFDHLARHLIVQVIDAFDDLDPQVIREHLAHLTAFFIEASTIDYEFCQPRVILNILGKCVELDANDSPSKPNLSPLSSISVAVAILELCQTLIRHQDYEIFQPELSAMLSALETSNDETDIKHRAWMLRSLITHVNTDNLKDAFDVDMDLSQIGRIEHRDTPLIAVKILFDSQPRETQSIQWTLNRKRSGRSLYFALELQIATDSSLQYPEFFGIRIDFDVDPAWGQIDSIYIPILQLHQTKKGCLHVQPASCTPVTIHPKAVLSTTDGRILWSKLNEFHLNLQHILSPLASTASPGSTSVVSFNQLCSELTAARQDDAARAYSSVVSLERPEQLLSAISIGELKKFHVIDSSENATGESLPRSTALALVTPDCRLLLIRLCRSARGRWYSEVLVEDPYLLSVAHSLLSQYSDEAVQ